MHPSLSTLYIDRCKIYTNLSVCIHMYVYMYIYIHMSHVVGSKNSCGCTALLCIYIYMYVYIYIYVCIHIYMYIYIYICKCICTCICMYLCMYQCMYVCMYACMYSTAANTQLQLIILIFSIYRWSAMHSIASTSGFLSEARASALTRWHFQTVCLELAPPRLQDQHGLSSFFPHGGWTSAEHDYHDCETLRGYVLGFFPHIF